MMGFGPVAPEKDEPLFHGDWEKRALAVTLAMGATGTWPGDTNRHTRESLPWAQYLSSSYYEIWIAALEKLLAKHGLLEGPPKLVRTLTAGSVATVLAKGTNYARAMETQPVFAVGDVVRCRQIHSAGHSRLPGYAKGVRGVVARWHGGFIFPDTNAVSEGLQPQHLYTVRFATQDVFGGNAGRDDINIDLFEPYLEAAS